MNRVTTLGQYIRQLREKCDISLRELAGKLKISAAFLSDVELGRRHPSEKVLARIARLLETSLEDLRNHDTRPPVDQIRELSNSDPVYGLAFRKIVDKKISAEELLRLAEQAGKKTPKKK